jgi:hypothetical protein
MSQCSSYCHANLKLNAYVFKIYINEENMAKF